ncbi:hypothetical protein C2E23DRAFT_869084 [Lenzites betulinus]|nr:hypothetical protein C2E23DRAFT_869084 [Lenzites betulinus]
MAHNINVYPTGRNVTTYANMDKYVSIKLSCVYGYREEHDYPTLWREASAHLTKWCSERLLEHANQGVQGNPEVVLDMALRYLSGCGTRRQNVEGALFTLDALLDPQCQPSSRYVGQLASDTTKAKAHAFAGQAYLMKLTATPAEHRRQTQLITGDRATHNLLQAAQHANACAELGLISPVVLRIGFMMREVGVNHGVDLSTMVRSSLFRALWIAVNPRLEEIYAQERRTQARMDRRSPSDFVCAAPGCGFRSEERTTLRACAGRCPRDLKPHYCSKQCQIKDWARHKPTCKPGSNGTTPVITDQGTMLNLSEVEDGETDARGSGQSRSSAGTEEETGERPLAHGPPGPERIVNTVVPNAPRGSVQIRSNTLAPEALRSLREEISNLAQTPPAS